MWKRSKCGAVRICYMKNKFRKYEEVIDYGRVRGNAACFGAGADVS